MENIQLLFWIIISVVIGTGFIIRQSIINNINEKFKNESFEKQKRWELKQEIYFSLLESSFRIAQQAKLISSLFNKYKITDATLNYYNTINDEQEADFKLLKEGLKSFGEEIFNLTKYTSTARIILHNDTYKELCDLLLPIKSDSVNSFLKVSELAEHAHEAITEIAKKDLNIEAMQE